MGPGGGVPPTRNSTKRGKTRDDGEESVGEGVPLDEKQEKNRVPTLTFPPTLEQGFGGRPDCETLIGPSQDEFTVSYVRSTFDFVRRYLREVCHPKDLIGP